MLETTKKNNINKKKTIKSATVKPALKSTVKTKTITAKKPVAKKPVAKKVNVIKKTVKKPIKKVVKRKAQVRSKNVTKKINFIKGSFLDVFMLYKNFIHWNISKFFVFLWSVTLGAVAAIPLIIILFTLSSIFNVDLMSLIGGTITGNLVYSFVGYFILLFIIITFFIFFSYSNILLININNAYLDGKKLSYKLNDYFNFKKIIKYFNLTILNLFILLIPILLFVILIGLLFLFSGSLENINKLVLGSVFNHFTIISFVIFIVCTAFSAYLFYRIVFSYFVFSDIKYYNEKNNVIYYLKESFNKTKKIKNFFKFILIFIIFSIFVSPINYFGKVLEKNDRDLGVYDMFLNLSEEQRVNISGDDLYYIEILKLNYKGLDVDEIKIKIKQNNFYIILFSILNFMFLSGLFVMVTSSFYRRKLI